MYHRHKVDFSIYYPVTKLFVAQSGIVSKMIRYGAVLPATTVVKGLWEVPVVEGHHWSDVRLKKGINQLVVIIYSWLVDFF